MQLRPYQLAAVEGVRRHIRAGVRRVLLVAPTGAGKCLGIGTPVLMFDGRVVPVENVRPGNLLMGPGSEPRSVLSTTRDEGPLYRIVPTKGDPWVCNDVHVLTLVHTSTGEIVDIPLDEYLALSHRPYELFRVSPKSASITERTGFTVEPIGRGPYAGFELDGDGRFLLGDFTVTHNTVIASHMIECSVALGNRVLFLAHRRELITQAFKKVLGCTCRPGYDHDSMLPDPECRATGLPRKMVGVLMANDPRRNPVAVVQVASVDTLRNRAKPPADLIVVDEAHRTLARSYKAILEAYPEAAVTGLTATPYRADNRGLGEEYDELVVVASPRQLIDEGFLVDPRVFTVPAKDLPDLSRVRVKGGDYDLEQLGVAVNQAGLVGNIVEHWKRRAEGRQTVVFAGNVEHSKHIIARFRESGVAAEHLDGAMPTAERDAILARLDRGETRVVSNFGVLTEGWDQPSVKCCILARPTKSLGLYLQMAGRILRPWRDTAAIILDHAGCALEHGLPQDDREFTLEAKKKSRTTTAPSCKTCEECYAIVPSATRICPACGMEFPVADPEDKTEEKEGELVEVRPATIGEKKAAWDEICQVAIDKGYKPGWAFYRYKDRFGVSPPSWFRFPEIERPPATEDEKREYVEGLRETQQARGYSIGWIYQRFRAKFGEEIPAAWLAPRPIAEPEYPTYDPLEEWPF